MLLYKAGFNFVGQVGFLSQRSGDIILYPVVLLNAMQNHFPILLKTLREVFVLFCFFKLAESTSSYSCTKLYLISLSLWVVSSSLL